MVHVRPASTERISALVLLPPAAPPVHSSHQSRGPAAVNRPLPPSPRHMFCGPGGAARTVHRVPPSAVLASAR